MILRPDAVVLPDGIREGVEVRVEDGRISGVCEWSSSTREESGLVLSPAFVNAHSHLEYYDLKGKMPDVPYWEWIIAITQIKPKRTMAEVQEGANECARLNVRTGITAVGECSDWPVAGEAMHRAGLAGHIFQEVLTLGNWHATDDPLDQTKSNLEVNQAAGDVPVVMSPHATFTVAPEILRSVAAKRQPQSIHLSESAHEVSLFRDGSGPIADLFRSIGAPLPGNGELPTFYLDNLGCLHEKTQAIHCCELTTEEIEVLANRRVTVAHCPRSNITLKCSPAPIAEMLRAGIDVGIGLDSAASSGEVDMFDEMRAALTESTRRGDEVSPDQAWWMATEGAARSIWIDRDWRIEAGAAPDMMLFEASSRNPADWIQTGSPETVKRLVRLSG